MEFGESQESLKESSEVPSEFRWKIRAPAITKCPIEPLKASEDNRDPGGHRDAAGRQTPPMPHSSHASEMAVEAAAAG